MQVKRMPIRPRIYVSTSCECKLYCSKDMRGALPGPSAWNDGDTRQGQSQSQIQRLGAGLGFPPHLLRIRIVRDSDKVEGIVMSQGRGDSRQRVVDMDG
jgi:hypothetical protein